jgi:hypothetical protein
VTRRTTTSLDAAEAAFKAATTKPAELPPKRPGWGFHINVINLKSKKK